jgi:hypothetical protein
MRFECGLPLLNGFFKKGLIGVAGFSLRWNRRDAGAGLVPFPF